ncbi:DUF1715-domain-containing protein [Saitoella complicata NRRL Y-17804]|uniref:Essential protein Yae1 N-terminal domain-containing protein n=1 Tax=Saitoella complicata (strain BCRC 22490 / CBS 7301 / JCM 7358 / NBRC 10748 / NRRL Y-17804) TaxID=698492 RepID=A0A0E9N9J1_SAICN|nr:DUF1715-domain-containing protein [Saitoella complicata NRRL Y-17804]ODQ56566.1 DUF1715-domain-containing protein [Saitoella complicata NRRL Y-17804]GAO46458.1 hypothetical protein G7K_0689-t1 [Saitoella complicata NRRL Y-17804]
MANQLVDELFDPLLNLEESFYKEGHEQGYNDGLIQGEIEGRRFGLENAYQRFRDLGIISGRCLLWRALLSSPSSSSSGTDTVPAKAEKQLARLESLLAQVPMENSEGGDFDTLWLKIKNKAKVVSTLVGEGGRGLVGVDGEEDRDGEIESGERHLKRKIAAAQEEGGLDF